MASAQRREKLAALAVELAHNIKAITRDDYEENASELFGASDATALRAIAKELRSLPSPCSWKADEDGIYHTTCDRIFTFIDDGPTENKFAFCCYCGGGLRSKAVR